MVKNRIKVIVIYFKCFESSAMCDLDSPTFQAMDTIGYCFTVERQTQEWKDKVLENVESSESARVHCFNIKITLEHLLNITELWEIPCGDEEDEDYMQFWNSGRLSWIEDTLKKAEPYFDGWYKWNEMPDEEYHVRVMSYFLKIDKIW